ncbi:lipoprotein [Comamonas sp. J-3]|uniref:LPS translocon maturation chaperone LptM n=1 Tax=Comamonas trifloxystrobinivorans TaxID=3350256 RepID=UPI0037266B24
MRSISQIVCRTIVLASGAAVLVACGQKGPLYLPQDPAAANRATLPQTLDPRTDTPELVMQPAPARPEQKQ